MNETSNQAIADITTYHLEDGIWWVEDSRLPGFTAVGDSPDEVSAMLCEAFRHIRQEMR